MVTSFENFIKLLLISALLIALQLVVFDNLTISSYAYIPIYLIVPLSLPVSNRLDLLLIFNFVFGAIIDLLSGTNGVVTISLLTVAILKHPIVHFFILRESISNTVFIKPSLIGRIQFVLYILLCTLVFNATLILVESMGYITMIDYLKYLAMSTLFATPFIVVSHFLIPKRVK